MTVLRRLRRRRELAILLVVVASAAIAIVSYVTHLTRSLELQTVDARFGIRGTQEQPDDVAIVAVDDRTFSELGRQWPFPRSLHGRVIDRLREAGAKAIAIDIQFTEPTDAARGQRPDRGGRPRRRRRPLDDRSRRQRAKPTSSAARSVLREFGARAGQHRWSSPTPAAVIRKISYSKSTGSSPSRSRRPKPATGEADRPRRDGRRRRGLDRLPRPAGDAPPSTPTRGSCAARSPTSAFRGKMVDRRRLRALAAGRPRRPRPAATS